MWNNERINKWKFPVLINHLFSQMPQTVPWWDLIYPGVEILIYQTFSRPPILQASGIINSGISSSAPRAWPPWWAWTWHCRWWGSAQGAPPGTCRRQGHVLWGEGVSQNGGSWTHLWLGWRKPEQLKYEKHKCWGPGYVPWERPDPGLCTGWKCRTGWWAGNLHPQWTQPHRAHRGCLWWCQHRLFSSRQDGSRMNGTKGSY